MRLLGCTDATLETARARHDDGVFEVWEENWPVLEVFLTLARQWRWIPVGMGAPLRDGIDACAIEAVFRLLGVKQKDRKEIFAALRLMEDAVIEVQSKRVASG